MGVEPWSPALQMGSLPPELPGEPRVGKADQAQEVVYSRHEAKRHPGTIITIKSGLSKCSHFHIIHRTLEVQDQTVQRSNF